LPYTTHGWWFGHGAPTEPGPRLIAKCGGPHVCPDCAVEAHRAESETPVTDIPDETELHVKVIPDLSEVLADIESKRQILAHIASNRKILAGGGDPDRGDGYTETWRDIVRAWPTSSTPVRPDWAQACCVAGATAWPQPCPWASSHDRLDAAAHQPTVADIPRGRQYEVDPASLRDQKPYVAAIVHATPYGQPEGTCTSWCRAAIITEVMEGDSVEMHVFGPGPTTTHLAAPTRTEPGREYFSGEPFTTWHFAERA
jgi:hypothetical protein